MLLASLPSDVLLWLLVGGYGVREALNRMFGDSWPKLLGDYLREWWITRGETDRKEL